MLLALAAFAVQPTCRDLTQQQPRRVRPAATSGSIWDDMLMPPGRPSVCGKHKCYFQSARTPGTGYLVMRHEIAGDAWYFSNCLQQRYGVRHFVAAPAVVAKATDEMLSRLAKMHLVRHGTRNGTSTTLGSNSSVIQSGSTMWVQKVRQAPATKLFAACRCHKRRRRVTALPDFCAAVTGKKKFRRRVSESVQARAALIGDRSQSATRLPALTHSLTRSLTHPLSQPLNHSLRTRSNSPRRSSRPCPAIHAWGATSRYVGAYHYHHHHGHHHQHATFTPGVHRHGLTSS